MSRIDSALGCLVQIAARFSIPADYSQLSRAYITDANPVNDTGLLIAARDLGLKARAYENVKFQRLEKMPRPLVCRMVDGGYVLVTRIDEDGVVLFDPRLPEGEQLLVVEREPAHQILVYFSFS
jgi:subfamily B ATP-binding cassette protein HlyB/CyaB